MSKEYDDLKVEFENRIAQTEEDFFEVLEANLKLLNDRDAAILPVLSEIRGALAALLTRVERLEQKAGLNL